MGLQVTLLRTLPRTPTHPLVERALLTVGLVALWVAGYQGIGRWVDVRRASSLETRLDDVIPFVPESVFVYVLVYAVALLPAFVIKDRRLFRAVCANFAAVIGLSLATFALFPVSVAGFRPDASWVDASSLTGWGVRTVFALDPPTNGFPSLHVGLASVAALGVCRAVPGLWIAGTTLVTGTIASTVLLKQHFLADSLGALAVVALAYAVTLRRFRCDDDAELACGWREGGLFLGLSGLVLALVLGAWTLTRGG